MKRLKKMATVVAIAAMMLSFSLGGEVLAANGSYLCHIDNVGTGWQTCYIYLSSLTGGFTGSLKTTADPDNKNMIMATALTAMAMGYDVTVVMDITLPTPKIWGIYVNSQ